MCALRRMQGRECAGKYRENRGMGKRMGERKKSVKRAAAMLLAVVLASKTLLPILPQLPWRAQAAQLGDTIIAYGAGFHHYCIDGAGANRALIDGDEYVCILPSETLSREEMALVFWGMLTLQASFGNMPQVNAVIQNINAGAAAQGIPAISQFVTEADLKLLIHSAAVRGKYPWLKEVLAKEETYLQLAGLLGGGARTTALPGISGQWRGVEAVHATGGGIPSVLQGHTQAGNPLRLTPSQENGQSGEYVLSFDPSGADAEFIRTVPLKYSTTGADGSFTPQLPGGWVCQKTDTEIRLTSTGGSGALYLMFDVRGTQYASGGGTFSSPEEVYDQCLQIWRCSRCAGTHRQMYNGAAPLSAHQRLAFVEVNAPEVCYYAGTGVAAPGGAAQGGAGSLVFEIYRHEEEWTSTYNVRLRKYDHETGKPLENAVFSLYERFDDKEEVHTDRDGAAYIYAGGAPYKSFHKDSPVLWDDFRFVSAMITDEEGESGKTVEHGYHYDKTFCDGHPAPVFVPVPEEEEDEETGEIENQAEIAAAKEENRRLASLWQSTFRSCEAWAGGDFSGVHFHWLMPEVDMGEIGSIASGGGEEGETPSAGATVSAGGTRSFTDSGCESDTRETYARFIALKYSYAIAEDTAREGYTLHGNHRDDLPIEVITTDASENGANASFAGLYSRDIQVSDQAAAEPARVLVQQRRQAEEGRMAAETEVPVVKKESKSIWQRIFAVFFPTWIDEESLVDDRKEECAQKEEEKAGQTQKNMMATASDAWDEEHEPDTEGEAAEQKDRVPDMKKETERKATISNAESDETGEQAAGSDVESDETGEQATGSGVESGKTKERQISGIRKTATASDLVLREVENRSSALQTDRASQNEEDDAEHVQQWILKLQFPEGTSDTSSWKRVPDVSVPVTALSQTEDQGRDTETPKDIFQVVNFKAVHRDSTGGGGGDLFAQAYNRGLNAGSSGSATEPGPSDHYSHCNGQDGEDDWWRIYDHRTEGEIHINKRDMDLKAGESNAYDSYGDTQGDAVLEGAVYGLFAAKDLVHPDGKTGVVYQKDDLTAVTATDKNGDASFLAFTEAPGWFYDYEKGGIVDRPGNWNRSAPSNLYTRSQTFDDYTEDGQYQRTYQDYQTANGNCWIGRPLLMGEYYVKELSRSEGYELSIGNRKHSFTNTGQDLSAVTESGNGGDSGNNGHSGYSGYVTVTKGLYAEQQVQSGASGAYGDPTFRELFFEVNSEKSGGFDLAFSGIPAGSRLYRLDKTVKTEPAQIGTGSFTGQIERDVFGNLVYVTTEYEGQYPKYDADGTMLTRKRPVNRTVSNVAYAEEKELDPAKCEDLMRRAEKGLDEAAVLNRLRKPFAVADFMFLKYKLELILRANGKGTPKQSSDAGFRYSTLEQPVYDTGYRIGVQDSQIQFGAPVVTLEIPWKREETNAATIGEVLAALLDFYQQHAYYSYGGLDQIRETEDTLLISIYAGRTGNPECFFVPEKEERDAAFYLRVPFVPEETGKSPRYIYAVYGETESEDNFGIYADFSVLQDEHGEGEGVHSRASAVLVPDAEASSDGSLMTRCIKENVYYEPGETPLDASGNRIPKVNYIEETVPGETQKSYGNWSEITSKIQETVWHVESSYTDHYGAVHSDDTAQQYWFKLVLPGAEQVVLTEEDIALMQGGWSPGDTMGTASYYQTVKQVRVQASLDYQTGDAGEENSFVKRVTLVYPGQDFVWQDGEGRPGGGTATSPVPVEERGIRQQIRISKTIEKTSYNNTSSYADAHEDWWTRNYDNTEAMDNFRFKVYLKSNLRKLYRNENGEVIWQDRKGNERSFAEQKQANTAFPEKVNQIYTKVLHRTDPLYKDSNDAAICNEMLYAYQNGKIQEHSSGGYTAILETTEALAEDGTKTRTVKRLNYEKFFDAVETANHDKWDDAAPTYTSYRPIGNKINRSDATVWNSAVSDRVRQFAITWYLDDEIAKLVETAEYAETAEHAETAESVGIARHAETPERAGKTEYHAIRGSTAFSDEILDQGLQKAIEKAQNYLKPFFRYDLDELYAIAWDAEEGGGADHDVTTVSADTQNGYSETEMEKAQEQRQDEAKRQEAKTEYYGISARLPYGTYVVVEQQPKYASLEDFKNRHYEVDKPKEISLPAVYADEAGAEASPGEMDSFYQYKASYTAVDLEKRYHIRFLEESHVIRAHGDRGDFEIYKYGMEPDRIQNGPPDHPDAGDYFALTQSKYRPFQNYYNSQDDRTTGVVPYYLSEGQSGRNLVSAVYRYSSVSEQAQTANDVAYPGGAKTDDNVPGTFYRDQIPAMQGTQTAYDGCYAPMLVPYSVSGIDNKSSLGYGNVRFRNRFYTARVRIEKLDSETHENILHDGAIFRIYAAKRDDAKDGEGKVLFYEEDTLIDGSRDFLTAMGATDIRPVTRGRSMLKGQAAYTGMVPAGTPVCEESEQILLGDRFGLETGVMKAFATVRDGQVQSPGNQAESSNAQLQSPGTQEEDPDAKTQSPGAQEYQLQTVGYLNTPQPLSAGTYVLCETKPPAGYVRSKPVALEIYSDQVAYYQNGNRDSRVLSAVYEDAADEQTTWKNKPQDQIHTARVYLENEPIRLQVEKREAQAAAGSEPDQDLRSEHSNSEGTSGYVAGAKMTLFDAILLTPSGDTQDFTYEGLVIERNDAGYIDRMYVKEGYGGQKTEFLPERDEEGHLYTVTWPAGVDRYGEIIPAEGNSWNSVTVMRPDTDILYYDLSNLSVTITPESDGRDGRYQAFAWNGAFKFLEFTGGDLTKIVYDEKDKILTLDKGTHVYHLGRGGERDALVDPYTGMAYVVKDFDGTNGSWDQIRGRAGTGKNKKQVLVWPVNLRRDEYGNIIARDKITTCRMALSGDGEQAYLTGSWKSAQEEESHRESSLYQNETGQNLNDEVLLDDNNGKFEKSMNPVYDQHGLVTYYQQSKDIYDKATKLYDRNGDFVRSQNSDNLEAYNHAAYAVQEHTLLQTENEPLSHRQGEAYVMENTWITSEQYPNDPFASVMTEGSTDILERVAAGSYIMEELQAPKGFVKALPMGILVKETNEIQQVTMTDEATKTEFSKTDGVDITASDTASSDTGGKSVVSGSGLRSDKAETGENSAFDCGYVTGAVLGLWKTESAHGAEAAQAVSGENQTASEYAQIDADVHQPAPAAVWTTTDQPHTIAHLPTGEYLWKEIQVPSGFVSHEPVTITVAERPEVQKYEIKDDHTRIEVEKYCLENGKDRADGETAVGGAEFTLYPAKLDANGQICYENGLLQYETASPVVRWITDDGTTYRDFPAAFETMYLEHGAKPGSSVMWDVGERLYRAEFEAEYQKERLKPADPQQTVLVYRMENGVKIRIGVTKEQDLFADHLYRFEYQFDWKALPQINPYACTYLTLENHQRFDYLPAGASYVLVETKVPEGFARAGVVLVTVKDTGAVQLYRVENEEGTLLISKVYENGGKELAGARLALYRANEEGGLTRSSRYLFDTWVSGSDGRYTELDAINRRIPQGYAQGDLKPHRIRRLTDGLYWLAEQESPDYYTTFLPVQIEYQWQPEIRIVRVNDRSVTGTLKLEKTDSAGNMLQGAVFELTAYRDMSYQDRTYQNTVHQNMSYQNAVCKNMKYRGSAGQDTENPASPELVLRLRLEAPSETKDLPVGEVLEDGTVRPFWYELREVVPPSGYVLNPEVIRWQFEPDLGAASYPWRGTAQKKITVTDRKTRIVIAKVDADAMKTAEASEDQDKLANVWRMEETTAEVNSRQKQFLDTWPEDIFLAGAELAVYGIVKINEAGEPVYNEDTPLAYWTTEKEAPWHALEGLKAGGEYLLKEVKAPEGYEYFEPVRFRISEDGGRIAWADRADIWNGTALAVKDKKIPEQEIPDEPEPDKPPKEEGKKTPPDDDRPKKPEIQPRFRIGRILAWYQPSSPDGTGWLYLGPDGRWKIRLPQVGDERKTVLPVVLILLSAAGLGIVGKRKHNR